jgi:hypothetical protein
MLNPVNIDQPFRSIVDPHRYNGRVNIISQPDTSMVFKMQEKIALKNKATEYRSALSGNDWEDNTLSLVFFSAENIQIIQNGLRSGVYEMSNRDIIIPPQNLDQLKIIMRSIYFQYAEHYENDIRGQVERLNQLVLDYAIPAVYGEARGYLKYIQDQSSLVVPLDIPKHHDRQYKQLELKPWFYTF